MLQERLNIMFQRKKFHERCMNDVFVLMFWEHYTVLYMFKCSINVTEGTFEELWENFARIFNQSFENVPCWVVDVTYSFKQKQWTS